MQSVKVCGKLADKATTRGYGTRHGRCVHLRYEEALYLAERGFGDLNFTEIFENAMHSNNFDIRFFVYRDLRARGYLLKIRENCFFGKKSFGLSFYPVKADDFFSFENYIKRELPFIIAVVDGDGDITYYMVNTTEPEGAVFERVKISNTIVSNQRVFILDNPEPLKSYGKNEGLFSHLSFMEAKYLDENLDITTNPEIYSVYSDLRNRGLIVKSGFKYGTHFRVYEKSMDEHARYLIHVPDRNEEMQRVSRVVRVAHGVRKELLFARDTKNGVKYLSVSWIRP